MNNLKEERDSYRKKFEAEKAELEKVQKQIANLKRSNRELGEKFAAKLFMFDLFKLKKPESVTLDKKSIEPWRNLSRLYFDSIKKTIKLRDPNIAKRKESSERVDIKLPNRFILQKFFEDHEAETAPKSSTFLFMDLSCSKKQNTPENMYSYKLFIDWDVHFDGE